MTARVVVILSGGSEIVSVALVEEFLANGFRPAIVSLRRNSILNGLADELPFHRLSWPPVDPTSTAHQLVAALRAFGATEDTPIPVFPTEDGGLRLLLEQRKLIEPWGAFGSARALRLGGLDKAELFCFLDQSGCADLIAPFRIATEVADALEAIDEFNGDAVIKPALKPFSMHMDGMRAKAFFSGSFGDIQTRVKALKASWHLSERWIIQPRLRVPPGGETVVWAVRDSLGETHCMAANEVWKYPRDGGTGCWVRVASNHTELLVKTRTLLEKLQFIGVCEVPFLVDVENEYRLLELNPRPWLQIGLPFRAGVPMAAVAAQALQDEAIEMLPAPRSCSWVNIERLTLAALSGEQGERWHSITTAWHAWQKANAVAIYDTNLSGIRRRWFTRTFLRLLNGPGG